MAQFCYCFLSSVATDGNDGHELKLEKVGPTFSRFNAMPAKLTKNVTSNNQRLGNAGDNDQRSKRFCSIAMLCVSFTCQMVKTRVIRLRGVEGRDARGQIAFCAFHSFFVEFQTNAGNIHATHA